MRIVVAFCVFLLVLMVAVIIIDAPRIEDRSGEIIAPMLETDPRLTYKCKSNKRSGVTCTRSDGRAIEINPGDEFQIQFRSAGGGGGK